MATKSWRVAQLQQMGIICPWAKAQANTYQYWPASWQGIRIRIMFGADQVIISGINWGILCILAARDTDRYWYSVALYL